MSKKGTTGYKAELLRRKGERRIKQLEAQLKVKDISARRADWAKTQIKEIKSAMQGTRQYSSTGRRYKTKNEDYIQKQMKRLENSISRVPARMQYKGDSFTVTQAELNKASVGQPSIYSKTETQVFYRATQKIWQKEAIGEHERNKAIVDYFNTKRAEQGMSPLSFTEIVDYVLEKYKDYSSLIEKANRQMTQEQAEEYAKLDNEDDRTTSPTAQAVINAIRDAFEDLITLPDPTLA